ncbi:hypothetical protein [Yersinia ruckeri]|uniref:hypothetical protein n=2 Tax=Yersinia ruckeri TaxID=29486 RepID=UPI000BDE6FA1|nr:hypothetical protein [Yersinia ruckeri]EKN4689442.1 hypothetical protein [Yersinia ruckeri]MCK8540462.1 hypothetical protein [Yersinia ruckeri]MCK8572498.1 hypothetical protein [Yersinia ruckeri]MCK8575961.1 hypothetical protein [Yersinia ruckeri]MCK8579480.1 hypothetical protein [Yersinia ruckeri]
MSADNNLLAHKAAQEKVLIKNTVIKADDYHRRIISYAKKEAKLYFQQACNDGEHIKNQSQQQGYEAGIRLFLKDLISSLSHYQHAYHQAVGETEKRLKHKLVEIFSDPRTVEIVAEHFANMNTHHSALEIYVPSKYYEKVKSTFKDNEEIKIEKSHRQHLLLKTGDKIINFNPDSSSNQVLSSIFSPIASHQVTVENVKKYKELKKIISNTLLKECVKNDND